MLGIIAVEIFTLARIRYNIGFICGNVYIDVNVIIPLHFIIRYFVLDFLIS